MLTKRGEEKPVDNCTLETLEIGDRHKIILDQLRTIDKQRLIKVLDEERFSQRKLFPIEMKGVTW